MPAFRFTPQSHGARVVKGANEGSYVLFSETRLSSEDELLLTAIHESELARLIQGSLWNGSFFWHSIKQLGCRKLLTCVFCRHPVNKQVGRSGALPRTRVKRGAVERCERHSEPNSWRLFSSIVQESSETAPRELRVDQLSFVS